MGVTVGIDLGWDPVDPWTLSSFNGADKFFPVLFTAVGSLEAGTVPGWVVGWVNGVVLVG